MVYIITCGAFSFVLSFGEESFPPMEIVWLEKPVVEFELNLNVTYTLESVYCSRLGQVSLPMNVLASLRCDY